MRLQSNPLQFTHRQCLTNCVKQYQTEHVRQFALHSSHTQLTRLTQISFCTGSPYYSDISPSINVYKGRFQSVLPFEPFHSDLACGDQDTVQWTQPGAVQGLSRSRGRPVSCSCPARRPGGTWFLTCTSQADCPELLGWERGLPDHVP